MEMVRYKAVSRKCLAIALGLIIAGVGAVHAQAHLKLEIGAKIPKRLVNGEVKYLATAAAQMRPFIEVKVKTVQYMIAFDEKTRKIRYIYTTDRAFRAATGLKVGDEITVPYKSIEILGYFQLRAPAGKDGWQPVIGSFQAFEGDFLQRIEKDGKLKTKIEGFVKGYN